MKKERHGFLTFWLIFGIVMNVIFMLACALALDSEVVLRELSRTVVFICVILYFIGCICNVLLLNWKISGFYLYCFTSIISCVVDQSPSTIVLAILGPLLDFVFLQLKKNDISAWTHLTGNYSNLNNIVDVDETISATDSTDEISKYFSLKEKGIITDEEFEIKKRKLLGI